MLTKHWTLWFEFLKITMICNGDTIAILSIAHHLETILHYVSFTSNQWETGVVSSFCMSVIEQHVLDTIARKQLS
jgi:hypothetical protein